MKKLLLLISILVSNSYSDWTQDTLGDFYSGTFTHITFSELPGTRHIKNQKASIKLAPKSPNFYRTPWEPPRGEIRRGNDSNEFYDLDNDGDLDLLKGCYSGTHTILIVENIGTRYEPLFRRKGTFSVVSSKRFTVGDIDKDGLPDLLIGCKPNGTYTFAGYRGTAPFVWERKSDWDIIPPCDKLYEIEPELGDLNKDGFSDLIGFIIYSIHGKVSGTLTFFAWENNKGKGFTRKPEWDPKNYLEGYGFDSCNLSLELTDLDNDSDLDLVYTFGEYGDTGCQRNVGTSSPIWKRDLWIYLLEPSQERLGFTNAFADINGDGYPDLYYAGGGYLYAFENKKLSFFGLDGVIENIVFSQKEPWILTGVHTPGGLSFADLDNDRAIDHIIGKHPCGGHSVKFVRNDGSPEVPHYVITTPPFCKTIYLDDVTFVFPTCADLNNDGKIDLLTGSYFTGGWFGFRNVSTSTLSSIEEPSWDIRYSELNKLASYPFLVDLNADGLYDLIVGNCYEFYILQNNGTKETPCFERNSSWEPEGLPVGHLSYYKCSACDLDGDLDYDLILFGNSTMGIPAVYENIGSIYSPVWQKNQSWTEEFLYWIPSYTISPADLDNDGDYDFGISAGVYSIFWNRGDHYKEGRFTSSIIEISSICPLLRIWYEASVPDKTSLELYIRTQKQGSSWTDWRRITSGEELPINFNYIQYQANLSTEDLKKSPILYEVRMTECHQPLSFKVEPISGPIGVPITLKGEGFAPGKKVDLEFGVSTFTLTSSPKGSFSLTFLLSPQPATVSITAADGSNIADQTFFVTEKVIYVSPTNQGEEGGGRHNPYNTIQEAVNVALDGYRIEVGSGTYRENVKILKKIELIGIERPTIHPKDRGSAVSIGNISMSDADGSTISGFRITGAYGSMDQGLGINCFADVIISNNIITQNTQGGIKSCAASPIIVNNIIEENGWDGIDVEYATYHPPIILNNSIVKNGRNGIYLAEADSATLILNNIITENGTSETNYYGIKIYFLGTPTIYHNCLFKNGKQGTASYYNCQGYLDIFSDPMFVGNTDYHLMTTSSCIDAGTTSTFLPDKDMDENPRIVNKKVDIGAYEYQGNAFPDIILHKSSDKGFVAKGETITYTIRYENRGEAEARDVMIVEVLPEHCVLKGVRYQVSGVRYWYSNGWQETISSSATKIKWLIPTVAPGASGTTSFTVEVK